ncbi:sensor histidine kinase [Chryseobacterium sp. 2R14A]|uniref:sensor histidine kinase n=1 Tax=Chryseobacterium sp. 2R14A TaxID=3380353 RepID=UPI003CE718E2
MKFYYLVLIFFYLNYYSQRTTSQWYGMNEGLPQNSITDIAKDKFGFIWLATNGGIVRYDGANFLLYNNFKINNLSFADFLPYGNDGFSCLNDNEKNGLIISNRTVKVLPEEKVCRTDSLVKNIHYKRFYKNSFVGNFFPDIDYYYIDAGTGKYLFDNQKIEYEKAGTLKKTIFKEEFRHSYLKNVFEQNGIIYIADPQKRRTMILQKGIVKFDHKPSLYNDPKSKIYWHQFTKQVFVINDGNIYISKFINGNPTLKFLMHYENIENELLFCIFYDEDVNKFYFGTVVKGLNIVTLSNFHVPQKRIPFAGEVCYEALPYTQNSLLTKDGLEFSKNKASRVFSSEIKYGKRYLLYDDAKNLLYLDSKLFRRYRTSNYQKKDSIGFSGKSVEGLFKAGKNYILTISDYNSNYYLNIYPNDQFKKAKNIFRFKENISFVTAYDHDLLYVGTGNGIYLLSLSQNRIVKHIAKDLPIKEIQRTKSGNVWFTTNNKGFYLLKNNTPIKMPDDRNNYIQNAHHILEDSQDIFWISSNNGLFKVSEKMLLNYAHNKKSTVTYYRFTKENGLPNNEFNGGANPSGNILPNGDFVFPSMEGFVFFQPNNIKSHYPKKDHFFAERAQVGKGIIFFKDTLRLKSGDKSVDIFFDIPYYDNLDNIYLEAKLDDYEEWREIRTDKKYSFDNIEPGNYSLTIRFLVGDNGSFVYKKIIIEVVPYFYQTKTFKIFMVLLFIVGIIFIIQIRTNFLKIKNKKLKNNLYNSRQELQKTSNILEVTQTKLKNETEYQQKIVESISHDIMTPVKFITSLSQKLNTSQDTEIQKKYYDAIYKSSEQLFKFTLNLKEYNDLYKEDLAIDADEHSVYDIIEDKLLLFEEIASEKNTTILNLSDPLLKIRTNKSIIAAILHNIIDNSVKHTVNGEIVVTTILSDSGVKIEIFDTGSGMSKNQIQYYSELLESVEKENFIFKKYGLGLHIVIQLSKKIGAVVSFEQNEAEGTTVKILIKKHNYE